MLQSDINGAGTSPLPLWVSISAVLASPKITGVGRVGSIVRVAMTDRCHGQIPLLRQRSWSDKGVKSPE